jgi:hypothetical protein
MVPVVVPESGEIASHPAGDAATALNGTLVAPVETVKLCSGGFWPEPTRRMKLRAVTLTVIGATAGEDWI